MLPFLIMRNLHLSLLLENESSDSESDIDEEFLNAVENGAKKEEIAKLLNDGAYIETTNDHGETALFIAVRRGDLEVTRLLLDFQANVNASRKDGKTALCFASFRGYEDIVKLLLEKGARISKGDNQGLTALHAAALGEHANIAEILLSSNGLRIIDWQTTDDGLAALHYSVRFRNREISELFLSYGANVDVRSKEGHTPLFFASANGDEAIVKLLLYKCANVYRVDEEHHTVLHCAVESNNIEVVKIFLNSGLSLNVRNKSDETPLSIATKSASEEMIQLLLDQGAVAYEKDDTETIMHRTCKRGLENIFEQLLELGYNIFAKDELDQTILHSAIKGGNERLVEKLVKLGLDVNQAEDRGKTSLHFAAARGNVNIIELLLNQGCDIDAKTQWGAPALYFAAENCHYGAVRLLLERGATAHIVDENQNTVLHRAAIGGNYLPTVKLLIDLGINVNAYNKDGETALYNAVVEGHFDVVKELLNHGASIDDEFPSNHNCTVLHWACRREYKDIVQLLLERGASLNNHVEDDKNNCTTEILTAIKTNNESVVRLLLDFGADQEIFPRMYREYGEPVYNSNAILLAVRECPKNSRNNNLAIIEQLLDYGVNVNSRSADEDLSSLEYAVNQDDEIKVELLINYGANMDIIDEDGKSEWEYASYKIIRKIAKYLVLQESQNFEFSQGHFTLINSNSTLDKYYNRCLREIDQLKIEVIGNSTVTFYDLLTSRNLNQLAAYARNEDIWQAVKSNELQRMFPIYANTLRYQLKKGIWRKFLLGSAQRFFNAVSSTKGNESLPKLPLFCVTEILSYLENRELRFLMRVLKLKCDADIHDFQV